ncbi:heterokaryon incompatibility protein-domain-containing protein, partial [Phaeosphaeria sp. MPI-PUGE-AT-0046c]
MESATQPVTGCFTRIFRHDPLEHSKPSIRLILLLPDLWGAPDPSSPILVNGQLFSVRQNLLDFLDMARQNQAAATTYWIDALCIDQGNILERNHQVAQMGDIYSRATCVYAWLGATTNDQDMIPALRVLRDPEIASPQQWGLVSAAKRDLEDYICRNPYWERAWIVQEIFLARNVLVWLDTTTIPFEYLHWAVDYFYLSWKGLPFTRFNLSNRDIPDPKNLISKFEVAKQMYHGASLPALLGRFSGMKCEHARDHVFSLLSLCNEGHQFPVDYGSSDRTFFIETLKHCCASSCLC